jgi:hypothetical protein
MNVFGGFLKPKREMIFPHKKLSHLLISVSLESNHNYPFAAVLQKNTA